MIALGTGALQHETVEGGKLMCVEAQGRPAAGKRVGEFRSGPVDHWHEVVADGGDATLGQIAQRLPVIVEQRRQVAFADLDALVDWQALDDTPAQTRDASAAMSAFRCS